MGAMLFGHTPSNHPPGEQVDDYTKVHGVVFDFEIGNVADPYFVFPFGLELLIEQITLLILLALLVVAFGVLPDAHQPQLVHNFSDTLLAHSDTAFSQNNWDLLGTVPLLAVIKDLLNL